MFKMAKFFKYFVIICYLLIQFQLIIQVCCPFFNKATYKYFPKTCNYTDSNDLGPLFCLYSKKNADPIRLQSDSLDISKFDKKDTIFIVHGFAANASDKWIGNMRDAIFNEPSKENVIVVDWSKHNRVNVLEHIRTLFGFTTAKGNVDKIAEAVAVLVAKLCTLKDMKLENFSFVAHSLGGHLSGIVGKKLNNNEQLNSTKLRYILGMDVAGPGYEFEIDGKEILEDDPEKRLAASDASFVLALHTDGLFGINRQIGHVDVYVNGGRNQPECPHHFLSSYEQFTESFLNFHAIKFSENGYSLTEMVSCDHTIVTQYVIELFKIIKENKGFPIAHQCENLKLIQDAACKSCKEDGYISKKCIEIGNFSVIPPVGAKPYFLYTAREKPFMRIDNHQYAIHFDNNLNMQFPYVKIMLEKLDGSIESITLNEPLNLTNNGIPWGKEAYNLTAVSNSKLEDIFEITITDESPRERNSVTIQNTQDTKSTIKFFDYNSNSTVEKKFCKKYEKANQRRATYVPECDIIPFSNEEQPIWSSQLRNSNEEETSPHDPVSVQNKNQG